MVTDEETYQMKKLILEEITKRYEKLLREDQISDDDADAVLKFVKNKIAPEWEAKEFTNRVFEFCERFPEFHSVEIKVRNMRNELLQKIARECMENLMEDKVEMWSKLIEEIEDIDEEHLPQWLAKLPPGNRATFMETALNLEPHGA